MGVVVYYTAVSLDGFVAGPGDDLGWLFPHEAEPGGANDYDAFLAGVGALVMGRTTFDWVIAELARTGSAWPYTLPCWVRTRRALPSLAEDVDIRATAAPAEQVVADMRAAAGSADLWCVGGGHTAAWLHGAGQLDEIRVTVAPEVLGAGTPLLPARAQLELLDTARSGAFVTARYRVLR
jgi:dihydrofolate reductase